MDYKVAESREIVWCDGDDRYILIIKEEDAIVGLNFMQGDELDLFKRDFSDIDYDLTDFYNAVEPYLDHNDTTEVDRVNAAIWSFHEYSVLRDDRKYRNNLNK
jgi:hypothetical protein